MTFKITIEKDSVTAQTFKKFMAEKEVFRKAAQTGKVIENAKPTPVQCIPIQRELHISHS